MTRTMGGDGKAMLQKTPPSDLADEWLKIQVFAEGHRRFAEDQKAESQQHERVMARMIEGAKKERTGAETLALERFRVEHKETIRAIQRGGSQAAQEREETVEEVVLQHKEGIIESMGHDEGVIRMQLELWGGFCMICRTEEGEWREHDWRECPWYGYEIVSIKTAIIGIRDN